MGQQSRPLLPASLAPAEPDRSDQTLPSKKKRLSVRVACNNCRLKKAACDGQRPTCSRCIGTSTNCVYVSVSENETPSQVLKRQIDNLQRRLKNHSVFLEHLLSLPEPEALAMLRRLKSMNNAPIGLLSVKEGINAVSQPSQLDMLYRENPFTPHDIESELNRLHGAVYSPVSSLEIDSLNPDILRNNLVSSTSRYTFRSELFSDSSTLSGDINMVSDFMFEYPAASQGSSVTESSPYGQHAEDCQYCDPRLSQLNIGYWTTVPVSNEFAACAISLYLETYHTILGFFDVDLFLTDLIRHKSNHCSPFLVSALLSLACQSYSSFDTRSSDFSIAFMEEAEILLESNRFTDSLTTLSALSYLSVSAIWAGKDKLGHRSTEEAHEMAKRLKLFDIPPEEDLLQSFHELSPDKLKASAHLAWGCYGWLTLYASWFPHVSIKHPPILPIPGDNSTDSRRFWPLHPLPSYMGQTFTTLCQFWTIIQDINVIYILDYTKRATPVFAESKYLQLLAWADTLGPEMLRRDGNPPHVLIFHILFHCIVLTLFWPFVESPFAITFESSPSLRNITTTALFSTSVNQLKYLIYSFRYQFPTYVSTNFFLNPALLQVSSVLFEEIKTDQYWRFFFRLIFMYWRDAYVRYRISKTMVQAFLAMALHAGAINVKEAKGLMMEVEASVTHHTGPDDVSLSALLDIRRAMSDHDLKETSVSALSNEFEELLMFDEYTMEG